MNIRSVTDQYAVSEQITIEDVAEIKEQGFQSIVCHRPDDEDPGQPSFADIENTAKEVGIVMRHIPVTAAGLTKEAVLEMVDAVNDMPTPMLGYCRSGNRSTVIFQNAEAQSKS